MDTTLNFTVTPTASAAGSIDLPPLPKATERKWFTADRMLTAGAWAFVAFAIILAFRAAWRWWT